MWLILSLPKNVNSITQVTIKNYAGKEHTVKAKVLCAGLLLYPNLEALAGFQ